MRLDRRSLRAISTDFLPRDTQVRTSILRSFKGGIFGASLVRAAPAIRALMIKQSRSKVDRFRQVIGTEPPALEFILRSASAVTVFAPGGARSHSTAPAPRASSWSACLMSHKIKSGVARMMASRPS